nr:capping protein, Arp2/3 and myosin-I linker protein 2-like [Paramormyrops kingsleyae]
MASKETAVPCFVSVSREMTDSLWRIIDRSTVKFARGIKLDVKSGKSEDKILVLTTWRFYILAAKVPTKVELTFNFLEIRAMNAYPEQQIVIDTDRASYSLHLQTRDHLDHVMNYISFALSRIFNNSIFAPSVCRSEDDLSSGSQKFSPSSETSVETQRACGGFSETYAALCDYNGIICKEEVQWDVDTIYHSQDNREFNLLDFSHLETRDLAVIVASMAYNTWFTKLYCKDMRIGSEVVEQVLHTLSKSSSLEELTLENVGLKSDFPQKLSLALSENPSSSIHSLNLAFNTLDNQGVSNLIQQVCRLSKGLRLLNLSKTSLSSKGVVSLSQALCSTDEYSNSLLHLDLSRNPGVLSGEDASNLYLFLSQPNCLVHLDLSATDCAVDSLFGPLLQGCCADLSYLNLSKNFFSHRKGKEALPTFRQFFSSAFSLTHISLASMKLPPEALRALFLGLCSNPHINDLHLDVSGCELRSAGAAVIQELLPGVSSIATLDISDNGLDADLLAVLSALSRHPSIKHLFLGKNFNIKNRVLDEVLQNLVQLIQEEECGLLSLSLADSRLRSRGTVLVNALGSNTCLRKVDLSGNSLEDMGAKMLGKALQINTTLRSVTWDRNSTTATGLLDIARALEHNFTLQYMPLPLSDVTQAYRSSPDKTEQALAKIQRALLRNNQTQRFSQRQALRLHQGLVTSTAEQVMERLCVRVQQQLCVLRGAGRGEELQSGKQVLKEARNSRALYPSLCELAHVLSVDGPVRQKLDSLAGELARAADKELQVIVDSMVSLCRELCPLSSGAAERLTPPLSSVAERVSVPRSAIRSALMERAALDIHRAMEEVKLSVVSYLTNSIVDQILQDLYATHKTLSHQVAQVRNCDEDGEPGVGRCPHKHRDSLDITDEDLGPSIDTLAIKKRSGRTRRIRPVSTRLSLCDDSSSSTPPSAPPLSSPLSSSASWECLATLPTQGAPLHHVTRVRPRPPRRHRGGHGPLYSHCTENGVATPLDDGLPDFYTKRVLPDSQLSSIHKAQSLRRKKRRNMLAIFNFRRHRHSALANQSTDLSVWGGACGDECRTVATAPTGIATENVYTLLQPPRQPELVGEGTDVKLGIQRGEDPCGSTEGSRPLFLSFKPRSESGQENERPTQRKAEPESVTERQSVADKQTLKHAEVDQATDKQRTTHRRSHKWTRKDTMSDRHLGTERQSFEQAEVDPVKDEQLKTDRRTPREGTSDLTMEKQQGTEKQLQGVEVVDKIRDTQTGRETQARVEPSTDKETGAERQRQTQRQPGMGPTVDRQPGTKTQRQIEVILTMERRPGMGRQSHKQESSDMQTEADRQIHHGQSGADGRMERQLGINTLRDWEGLAEKPADRLTSHRVEKHLVSMMTDTLDRHKDIQKGVHMQTDRQSMTDIQMYMQTDAERQADRQTVSMAQVNRVTLSLTHSGKPKAPEALGWTGAEGQADRQMVPERETARQMVPEKQTDSHAVPERQMDREAVPERQTDRQTMSERQRDRQTVPERQTDRQTMSTDGQMGFVTQTDRQAALDAHTYRQTLSERQTDGQMGLVMQTDRQAASDSYTRRRTLSERQADGQLSLVMQTDRQAASDSYTHRRTLSERQTDGQMGFVTQTDRQAALDTHTYRQTLSERQTDGQMSLVMQTDRQAVSDSYAHRRTLSERQTDGQMSLVMQTDRQAVSDSYAHRRTLSDRQTDVQMGFVMQTDRQAAADRRTYRRTLSERQTDAQMGLVMQTDRQAASDRHTYRQTLSERQIDAQMGLLMQTDRQVASDTHTYRRTQPERQTDAQVGLFKQADRQAASDTYTYRRTPSDRQTDAQMGVVIWADSQAPLDTQLQRRAVSERHADRQMVLVTPADQQATQDLQMSKQTPAFTQMERQANFHPLGERRKTGESLEGPVPYGVKPDPPPQSSKPSLAKLRQRRLQESPGVEEEANVNGEREEQRKDIRGKDEDADKGRTGVRPSPVPEKPVTPTATEMANERKVPHSSTKLGPDVSIPQGETFIRPAAPVKPQRNRKLLSIDTGTDRDSPGNAERPPNRKPPVKKPRLPQNRAKSQELLGYENAVPGSSAPK